MWDRVDDRMASRGSLSVCGWLGLLGLYLVLPQTRWWNFVGVASPVPSSEFLDRGSLQVCIIASTLTLGGNDAVPKTCLLYTSDAADDC